MQDTGAASDTANEPVKRPADYNRQRAIALGVPSESCSAEMLGLSRFSVSPRLFRTESKGPVERLLNPFGDPWSERKRHHRHLSLMTSSCRGLLSNRAPELADKLGWSGGTSDPELARYAKFLGDAQSPYHYDETVSHLSPNMPEFAKLKALYNTLGIKKKPIAYTVANFADSYLLAGRPELPEHAYLHYPQDSLDRAHRVHFREASGLDASGDVFDIRREDVREVIVDSIEACVIANKVEALLVDYALRRYAFGLPSLMTVLPPDWWEGFQESQVPLLELLGQRLATSGCEVFLNGVMLDSIVATEPALVKLYTRHVAGVFWEQPFRWEWRDYNNGQQDYYQRLGQFFGLVAQLQKQLIIKSGTYRFHGTEDMTDDWVSRFGKTDHGIERHLAVYAAAFALLYTEGDKTHFLHTHPTELYDIYCSEAYFKEWDADIGVPWGLRIEIAPHIHMRVFSRGLVFLNNTLDDFVLTAKHRPAKHRGPFPSVTLPPLSGLILATPKWRLWLMPRTWRLWLKPRTSWIRPRARLLQVARWLGIRR